VHKNDNPVTAIAIHTKNLFRRIQYNVKIILKFRVQTLARHERAVLADFPPDLLF
jgi:hypothetical protein